MNPVRCQDCAHFNLRDSHLYAAKERLEHKPRYVVKAQAICTKMEKPQ